MSASREPMLGEAGMDKKAREVDAECRSSWGTLGDGPSSYQTSPSISPSGAHCASVNLSSGSRVDQCLRRY
ncbi:unnamed protein product [Sphagnum jensenii]